MNANLKNKLMPNTYVKLLIQDFDDLARLSLGTGISCDQLSASNQTIKVWQHLKFVSNALAIKPSADWAKALDRRRIIAPVGSSRHSQGAIMASGLF